ncbi:F-box domain-containing protein [Mycena kentingensis (nom. inval.)]|nr:F-box domain-containing protein [Mycena kentingensis (nom. inval.)]
MARRILTLIHNRDGLNGLPLDVLIEICNCLLPCDLMYLSRTNKSIRGFVMNPMNKPLWTNVYKNNEAADGPPGPPEYMSAPQWTHIVWDKFCLICEIELHDDPCDDTVWWEFNARFCEDCLPRAITKMLRPTLKRMRIPNQRFDWTEVFPRVPWDAGYTRSGFYLSAHQKTLQEKLLAAADDVERWQLISQRMEETRKIMAHAKLCRAWGKQKACEAQIARSRELEAEQEKTEAERTAKYDAMLERLRKLGWKDAPWMISGSLLEQLKSYPEIVSETAPLKRASLRSGHELEERIVAKLAAEQRRGDIVDRLRLFLSAVHPFGRLDELGVSIRPNRADVALIPQVRAVLDSPLAMQDVAAQLNPIISNLLQEWAADALDQVRKRAYECFSITPESTLDPLSLAIAIIPCPGRCSPFNRTFFELCQHTCTRAGHNWSNCQVKGYCHENTGDVYRDTIAQYNCGDTFSPSVYRFETGCVLEGRKNVLLAFDRDPETTTAAEMQEEDRMVKCLTCKDIQRGQRPYPLWLKLSALDWRAALEHCASHRGAFDAAEWELDESDTVRRMARKKLKISNRDGLNGLPLDLLVEICNRLLPGDLLHLSRTNKAIRGFVLNPMNKPLWKTAYENNEAEGGPPGPPEYVSAPQWAHIVWHKACMDCDSPLRDDPLVDSVWWEFGGRFCNNCLQKAVRKSVTIQLKRVDFGKNFHVEWERVFPKITRGSYHQQGYFLVADQTQLLEQLLATEDLKKRCNLVTVRQNETFAVMRHANLCRDWARKRILQRQAEDRQKQDAKRQTTEAQNLVKYQAMAKRLEELGWQDEDWMKFGKLLEHIRGYPEIVAAKQITTRGSRSLEETIIAKLNADKRKDFLTERLDEFKYRLPGLVSHTSRNSLPIVPRDIDIALIPEVKAVVDADWDENLVPVGQNLLPMMELLLQGWARDALERVAQHARESLDVPGATDPLQLAIAMVSCPTAHCPADRTYYGELCKHVCISGNLWSNPSSSCALTDEYSIVAREVFNYQRPFAASCFRFQQGRAAESMKNVVRAFGKDPGTATVDEMARERRRVRCLRCGENARGSAGMTWRLALTHAAQSHLRDTEPQMWTLVK